MMSDPDLEMESKETPEHGQAATPLTEDEFRVWRDGKVIKPLPSDEKQNDRD